MSLDQVISIVVSVAGLALSLGYYPQAYRIWKKKSAGDIAASSYLVFGIGTTVWLLYGIYLRDPVIIISFLAGVVGSWLVLSLTLYFRYIER
jgi:MtN3 and saliva related transmembrane protein